MLTIDWNNYDEIDKQEFYKDPVKFIKSIYPEYKSDDKIIFKNYDNDNSMKIYQFNDGDVISVSNTKPRNEYKSKYVTLNLGQATVILVDLKII